jgi:3-deoxy-7-phosphoheptulonate synthase
MDLRAQLEEVGRGERFILQGGDCAEKFDDCTSSTIETKLRLLFQMGVIVVWGARIPLTRIGRIAGQYHKPRSKTMEPHGDGEIPCYKGDAINGFGVEDRVHDPERLVAGYFHSSATLNYIRCLLDSGFADVSKYHPKE